ncbi:anthranilate synthase component II [Paraliomyxa miuraensis]|uniref:anthranilate synthase component II n=1 Tax=Paraliomyxa miuraensis TaxID=376150 RepID=UPI0022516B2D|nr:aminodeoxychorismate/anthranilate synthase component II [Paraliomyxa miuraensis]MCX4245763.1 aminodeoxychorismate/anthranilate synthase component II [Paraliomyxa miuraensis]
MSESRREPDREPHHEPHHEPRIVRYRPPGGPQPHVLVIDNYDSFTFNLVQYLLELGAVVDVARNDAIDADEAIAARPTHLLLSPGPGRPTDSGVCQALCRRVCDDVPIPTLGVCLGHQTLCEVAGATVRRADRIMHGKVCPIEHDGTGVLLGLPSPMTVTRYHSLVVEEATLPPTLLPIARTAEGELMAVRHRSRRVYGVQFHPESIASEHGHRLLATFLGVGGDLATRLDAATRG